MKQHLLAFAFSWMILICTSCGGAVVFAPTPTPVDLSPLTFTHPSGAFSIDVPRHWPVHVQYAAALASAAFTPPVSGEPMLNVAVANLGQSHAIATFINQYQENIRPDRSRYVQQDRQLMPDGSWRITGLRRTASGSYRQINTFIQQSGSFIGIIEVILPVDDEILMDNLQQAANTLRIQSTAPLPVSEPTIFNTVTSADLEIVSVSTWLTPAGVFFITGEVVNHGHQIVSGVPVRAALYAADGTGLAEAVDTVMGYVLLPGQFAPFSLRFGQGRPESAATYIVTLGDYAEGGFPWATTTSTGETVAGGDEMTWTDDFDYTAEGHLLVFGTLTNTGDRALRSPLAMITVFDADRNVIAAGFTLITEDTLMPGDSINYQIRVPEMGGERADHMVNIQAMASPED